MVYELMGIEITEDSFMESVEKAYRLVNDDKVSQVVTINPEMYAQAEKDYEFAKIIEESEMIVPDGIGIKLALLLKGYNVERIPGIDFARTLLCKCAQNNLPIAIIGAKEEIIKKAVDNLQKEISGINIVYYHNGYFDNIDIILENLKNTSPRLVLVALGSPKQEFFIHRAKKMLNPCLMIGIGGSLDVWSGSVKRAPKIFQRLGLEWLYRTILQPERFKRIFPALPLFLLKVITYRGKNVNRKRID